MSDRLLAQKEIVGGIHGECTMQSLRDKQRGVSDTMWPWESLANMT
jgi:hypothetical protein